MTLLCILEYQTKLEKGGPLSMTITGVAPWNMGGNSSISSNASGRQNPPVTVTGVAPWANSNASGNTNFHSMNTISAPIMPGNGVNLIIPSRFIRFYGTV